MLPYCDDELLISFDVSNLLANVPLDDTIDIISDRVYRCTEINTKIKKKDLKRLLTLCTKHVHFTFNGKMYIQVDSVAMGSLLRPLLTNIFMVELERNLIPSLQQKISLWKRYVDDTFAFLKKDQVEAALCELNSYHHLYL